MNHEPPVMNPQPSTLNPAHSFPPLVLFGVIWCSLVLFGPKFYFCKNAGSDPVCLPEPPGSKARTSRLHHTLTTSLPTNVYRPPHTLLAPHTPGGISPSHRPRLPAVIWSNPDQSEVIRATAEQTSPTLFPIYRKFVRYSFDTDTMIGYAA